MMNQKKIVKKESLQKALSDAKRKNFKSSPMPPKNGMWKNEHSFKTAISNMPQQSDKIFVVAIEDLYHNQSLEDSNWVVYTYDMDGNFIEKVHGKNLGGVFFMNLTYLQ